MGVGFSINSPPQIPTCGPDAIMGSGGTVCPGGVSYVCVLPDSPPGYTYLACIPYNSPNLQYYDSIIMPALKRKSVAWGKYDN